MSQKAICIWMTGLSGSGKSTLAKEVKNLMQDKFCIIVDGDVLRSGLNYDLKYSKEDRTENVYSGAQIAKLLVDNGVIALVTMTSPTHAQRRMAKDIIGWDRFLLVHVNCPVEICEQRDPKGLYGMARAGKIKDMVGVDLMYEEPLQPDIEVRTAEKSIEESAEYVYNKIKNYL